MFVFWDLEFNSFTGYWLWEFIIFHEYENEDFLIQNRFFIFIVEINRYGKYYHFYFVKIKYIAYNVSNL